MNIVEEAAASVLRDLPPTFARDQNAATLRDRLRDFGLDPDDPAAVKGALAGVFIVREQIQLAAGSAAMVAIPADLFEAPLLVAAIEGLAVMVDQHRKAGR